MQTMNRTLAIILLVFLGTTGLATIALTAMAGIEDAPGHALTILGVFAIVTVLLWPDIHPRSPDQRTHDRRPDPE
jgi:hypothetical protein